MRGKLLFAIAALAALAYGPAQARPARCVVKTGPAVAFQGPCNFEPDGRDGSFMLQARGLAGDVNLITVSVVSPGVAEVRGLNGALGLNSRWGEAIRSRADGACWVGSDFEICAY